MRVRALFGSLRWRTLATVFSAIAIVQFALGAKIIGDNRAAIEEAARQNLDILTQTSARALSAPLWDFDMTQVENAIAALETDPDIVGGWLNTPDGERIARFGKIRDLPAYSLITARHPVAVDHAGQREGLGTLTVQASTRSIEQAIGKQRRHVIQFSAVALLIACLAVLLIASTVIRPLTRIRRSILRVKSGDLEEAIPATRRIDEIGEIARAVEEFRKNLIEMRELRAENDRMAGEERLRIRSALESTEDAALILDEEGSLIFMNPPARRIVPSLRTGWAPDLRGKLRPMELARLGAAIRRREAHQQEVSITDPTGRDRRLSVRINPIIDKSDALEHREDAEHGDGFFGTVILAADVSDRVAAEQKIKHLANHDSLTGLPNRRVFEREVARRLSNPKLPQTAIFLLDLDRFKAINDMLGHQVGDRLLVRIGEILRGILREDDLIARLGGDEFAMLISGRYLEKRARTLASEVVRRLTRPVEVSGRMLHTGASVGYLIAEPGEHTGEEALRRADLALYEAKRSGRGRATLFEEHMTNRLVRKSAIESGLREAISQNQIQLAYQPQMSLPARQLVGFEALARWSHPELGEIGPSEFVPVAEESGLIVELSQSTISAAAAAAAIWRKRGFTGSVAVNLSPLLFRDDLVGFMEKILEQTHCPPEAIEVEITETVLLSDSEANRDKIAQLRELGTTIAIDDFGMGYSSLGYLRRFPVDRIKIDRAFVEGLGRGEQAATIVNAISELGHALGMEVTAEGVEREEQFDLVAAAGCDRVQGFLYGHPMSRETANEMVLDLVMQEAGGQQHGLRSA